MGPSRLLKATPRVRYGELRLSAPKKTLHGKSPCGHQLVWGEQGARERAEEAPKQEAERIF